ncbi:MAG: histidine kinase [Ruminococcus sp.]|nr:histidine kinase [Ruminococcus sp.]
MNFFEELIKNYYITFMLLAGLVLILIANRRNKIEGVQYVWAVTGLVFTLTLLENLEKWCDVYDKPVWILYFKAAVAYLTHPLLIIMQLYFIAPVKRKLLLLIPYFVDAVFVVADLFGLHNIYGYRDDHHFAPGDLHVLPAVVLCFYMILLMYYSLRFIQQKDYSRGVLVIFVSFSSMAATLLEYWNIIPGHTTEIAVIEILIYYFYLAAVGYSKTQKTLYESKLELERQRNKLLVMQMQPHFIFNALATIQSLCYTDSNAAAECIEVFGDYLRANIDSIASEDLIEFESELKHIDHYIQLEKASTDIPFCVIYELNIRNFSIPALTVQPIVENAIKHGALTRRDGSGFVKIKTEETDEDIIITVTDNGKGAALTTKQKEHKSVSTENVRKRLALQCGGSLDISISENGAVSVIRIPKSWQNREVRSDVYNRSGRQKGDRGNARKNARKH